MENKVNYRMPVGGFVYDDSYIQPDQSLTIGQIIERHLDPGSVSNHANEAFDDQNLDSPTRYDMDLTDVPTKYQDSEYFNMLESARKSFVDASTETNPKGLPATPQTATTLENTTKEGAKVD